MRILFNQFPVSPVTFSGWFCSFLAVISHFHSKRPDLLKASSNLIYWPHQQPVRIASWLEPCLLHRGLFCLRASSLSSAKLLLKKPLVFQSFGVKTLHYCHSSSIPSLWNTASSPNADQTPTGTSDINQSFKKQKLLKWFSKKCEMHRQDLLKV